MVNVLYVIRDVYYGMVSQPYCNRICQLQQIQNVIKTAFASLQQKRLINYLCLLVKLLRYSIGYVLCYMYFLLMYLTIMYQLQTVYFYFLFYLFIYFFLFFCFFFVSIASHQCYSNFFSIHLLSFVLYTWNDLSHRRPALMALTFPAAYHNRNVIFFSQCILHCCG